QRPRRSKARMSSHSGKLNVRTMPTLTGAAWPQPTGQEWIPLRRGGLKGRWFSVGFARLRSATINRRDDVSFYFSLALDRIAIDRNMRAVQALPPHVRRRFLASAGALGRVSGVEHNPQPVTHKIPRGSPIEQGAALPQIVMPNCALRA